MKYNYLIGKLLRFLLCWCVNERKRAGTLATDYYSIILFEQVIYARTAYWYGFRVFCFCCCFRSDNNLCILSWGLFFFDFISPNFTSILNWFLFRSIPLSMSHWTTHTHNIKTNRDSRSTLIIFLNANAWNFYAMRRCAFNSTDTKIDSEKIRNSARQTD